MISLLVIYKALLRLKFRTPDLVQQKISISAHYAQTGKTVNLPHAIIITDFST